MATWSRRDGLETSESNDLLTCWIHRSRRSAKHVAGDFVLMLEYIGNQSKSNATPA